VIAASADAGSNSVHLFVAVVAGHRLEPLLDESAFLGLGGVVDDRGRLGRQKRAELASTLSRFAGIARDLGAATTTFVATEPLRRASDARLALRDSERVLVKRANATITPEAAVFDPQGRLLYHGRIDNWYEDAGRARPAATTHELQSAVEAAISGKPVPLASANAVGCYISDLE